MKVIGTAGHIDHGKSTLVHRLTGVDPDRLSEEKRRGMTIELGFARLQLPSGHEVSIVDVPGHERFIRNMLAGAAGIDVALLVVAADEGVMPQTREHLDILDLLEVRHGVVALTKADLVEGDWLELVRDDVTSALRGTSLEGASIVAVSSVTGEGIAELLASLDAALAAGPAPRDRGRPFLPVDRVFSITGFGTVVTGTLHDGSLEEGMEVEIAPRHRSARIRSLQSHGARLQAASAGMRVAVNLLGVPTTDLTRGDVVAARGAVATTTRLDARVRLLPSSPVELRHGMQIAVHVGAAEVPARVSVLGDESLLPGAAGWVQLRLAEATALTRDQHLVLRLPAPARTIAGGVVVDTSPRHRRSDPQALDRLGRLLSPERDVALLAALESESPRSRPEAALRAGLSAELTAAGLEQLRGSGQVREIGGRYLTGARWDQIVARVRGTLGGYHAEFPLRRGMSKEELRARLGWRGAGWNELVRALVAAGVVRESGPLVALPDHGGGIAGRRADADRVLARLAADAYAPPPWSTLAGETGADEALMSAMVADGEVVRVDHGLYFERRAYDEMVDHVLGAIEREGSVTVGSVRDMLGTSRKYVLALLEHLDAERVTQRAGDVRRIGSKAPSRA